MRFGLLMFVLILNTTSQAQTTTIDFEAQGVGKPSGFTYSVPNPPLRIGRAPFRAVKFTTAMGLSQIQRLRIQQPPIVTVAPRHHTQTRW